MSPDTAARYRDSGLRSNTASASASELEELVRVGSGGKEEQAATEENVKLLNIDTGEHFELAEIGKRVPPSLDPGEVLPSKELS